jgi:hypothetical protein
LVISQLSETINQLSEITSIKFTQYKFNYGNKYKYIRKSDILD